MRQNYLTTIIFFLAVLSQVFGQKFQYVNYEGEDVPFEKVHQVVQDSLSYQWLATDRGLFRFDGTTFEDHNISLKSRTIKSIIPYKKDTLLFSNDEGVFKLNYTSEGGQIVPYIMRGAQFPELSYTDRLFLDTQERLWIAQPDGAVFLWNGSTSEEKKIAIPNTETTSQIYFGEDEFQTVWVLVPRVGVYFFEEQSQSLKKFGNFDTIEHFYVENDVLYLVGDSLLKITVDENKRLISRQQFDTEGLQFRLIDKDRTGVYFLATNSAIYTFVNDDGDFEIKEVFGSNDAHRVEELRYKGINDLYFSEDQVRPGGTLWVSTSNGLCQLSSSYFESVSGLSHDNVFTISTTGTGNVVISQNDIAEIYRTNGDLGFEKIEGLVRVTGISSFNRTIWYGTSDGTILQHQNKREQNSYDLSERGGGIFFMYADHKGDNWFCQAPLEKPIVGVAKISQAGDISIYDDSKGLQSRVLVVKEGGRKELYAAGIGVDSYLYKYDRVNDRFENVSLSFSFKVSNTFEVHDIAIDTNGMVWMATTDGLLKYDTERIQRIDLGQFTRKEVRSVAVTDTGSLWLATDTNGLIHLAKDGTFVLFDESSGIPSKVASYRGMVIDSNDHLWVGTAEGAVCSAQSNPTPLATSIPVLKSISVNSRNQPNTNELNLSESDVANLAFVSVLFPGDEVQYQSKVVENDLPADEIDDLPWSVLPETTSLIVRELDPGSYSMLVRAQKPGGYIWSDPLEMTLNVQKAWYKNWWAIVILAALGGLFFWYYVRQWLLKRIRILEAAFNRKQEELATKEAALRTQIASLEDRGRYLKSAGKHIYLLNRLLQQIADCSTWEETLEQLKKIVELPTGIDAFEIAVKDGTMVNYTGFKREQNQIVKRQEEFNEKTHLVSYVLTANKPLLIEDYDSEAGRHISLKDHRGYLSRILIPMEHEKGAKGVLVAYGKEKNKFSKWDVPIVQILATFLETRDFSELN